METHERGLGALIGLLAVASLCIGAGEAHAQSVFFVRLAPEVGRITVEHTKEVTIQGGSSSSTSSSSGLALAGNLSVGLLLELPGSWLVGGEIESAVSSRRKLEGTISPTPNGNVHDVWPGQWDFSDLYGAGGNILFGHWLGDGRSQVYVFGGIRRMWTEFAWPWAIGAGSTLHLKWPLDFRVRYSRSLTDWIVVDEGARLDYRYAAGGWRTDGRTRRCRVPNSVRQGLLGRVLGSTRPIRMLQTV